MPKFLNLQQFFVSTKVDKKPSDEPIIYERLRNEFIQSLLMDNFLTIRLYNDDLYVVEAISYDKRNHQIIVSDRTEQGILCLDKGDKVEIYSSLNDGHEYFSFPSQVVKVKNYGVKLIYYFNVPKTLTKTKRRIIPRQKIQNHSIVRIKGTNFNGRINDLSQDGIGFSLRGYYPLDLEIGYNLENCHIEIFQPRSNKSIKLECSVNIRRVSYVVEPERMTIIGGVINRSTIEQEMTIKHFLQSEH